MAYLLSSYTPLDWHPAHDPNNQFQEAYSILPSSMTLLFPFTNQAGFDTGRSIINTTLDPFGTPVETRILALYSQCNTTGGGKAPAHQTSPSWLQGIN